MLCCQAVTKVTGLVMSSVLGHHVIDRCHGGAKCTVLVSISSNIILHIETISHALRFHRSIVVDLV